MTQSEENNYYFSAVARRRGEDLQVGDCVRVRGLEKKYEIVEIFPEYSSVTVREIGSVECHGMPWTYIRPWRSDAPIKSETVMQSLGDVMFTGNRVYGLAEPDRVLRVKRIHWDRETSDLEDEQGQVYRDICWNDMEFWDRVDHHFPDEPN